MTNSTPQTQPQVYLDTFYLVGIATRTTNENQQAATDIKALWEQFWQNNVLATLDAQVGKRADAQLYAVYTEYEDDFTKPYTVAVGAKFTEKPTHLPDGFRAIEVHAGDYAVFSDTGDLTSGLVVQLWQDVWQTELNRAYQTDLEVYPDPATTNPKDAAVTLYIGVR